MSLRARLEQHGHELVLVVLLIVLGCVANALMPSFLKWDSQLLLSRQLWELEILALGMTLVVIAGGIDLSIGSTMGLSAVMFGWCFSMTHSAIAASMVCLATGIACGSFNGLLISRSSVHPLIVTLATFAAFRGVAEGFSQGRAYSQFGEPMSQLVRESLFGIPIVGLLVVLLAIGSGIVLGWTPAGRYIRAIGTNELAARFAGVPIVRTKFVLYTVSGLLAGIATLIYISRFDTAKADAGKGMELEVITAVVVGGTSIFGGRGGILGTCLGLILIHESRLFVTRYWRIDELRSIVMGSLLIVSVLVYQLVSRREQK